MAAAIVLWKLSLRWLCIWIPSDVRWHQKRMQILSITCNIWVEYSKWEIKIDWSIRRSLVYVYSKERVSSRNVWEYDITRSYVNVTKAVDWFNLRWPWLEHFRKISLHSAWHSGQRKCNVILRALPRPSVCEVMKMTSLKVWFAASRVIWSISSDSEHFEWFGGCQATRNISSISKHVKGFSKNASELAGIHPDVSPPRLPTRSR